MGSSSAAIAVPLIADELGIGHGATWTVGLYVLMLAVASAVCGGVCELVGPRSHCWRARA